LVPVSLENAAKILLNAARNRPTLTTYDTRQSYAQFGHGLIDAWANGYMSDDDFRTRLATLAVCTVTEKR
jgi:hypothetical protein